MLRDGFIVDLPEQTLGDWSIKKFVVSDVDARTFNIASGIRGGSHLYNILPGTYTRLCEGRNVVMSDTPMEIRTNKEFVNLATGDVLINGLGLGMVLKALLAKDGIKSITVIEKSADVIAMVACAFADEPRVTIIHADAFEYKAPKGVKYDYVWHDIWTHIASDNLKGMERLRRKYASRTEWQGFWARDLCKDLKRLELRRGD